jgi:hypothetical protein
MALTREHDLHKRRMSRNVGLGLALGAFVLLTFGLTMAKIQGGSEMQGFDHSYQPELDPATRLPREGE